MLYVQHVFIEWTDEDAKRADLELRRHSIELAYPLGSYDPSWGRVHETVRYLAQNGYEKTKLVRPLMDLPSLSMGGVMIFTSAPILVVDFVYSQDLVGLPKRSTEHALRLPSGTWGRVAYAGTSVHPTNPEGTLYRQSTFNIYWGETPPPHKLFVESEPFQDFYSEVEHDVSNHELPDTPRIEIPGLPTAESPSSESELAEANGKHESNGHSSDDQVDPDEED